MFTKYWRVGILLAGNWGIPLAIFTSQGSHVLGPHIVIACMILFPTVTWISDCFISEQINNKILGQSEP